MRLTPPRGRQFEHIEAQKQRFQRANWPIISVDTKWNPIEHRLFSQITLNWAGCPLRSFDTLLSYLRGTTTRTGLTVRAMLLEGTYAKGQKVSDAEMCQ